MLENSIYAVLSPEGFASILWKDGSRAMEAAELMKITSHELLEMGNRRQGNLRSRAVEQRTARLR